MNVIQTLVNKSSTDLSDKAGYCVEFDTTGMDIADAITDQVVGVITAAGVTESDVCIFGECLAIAGGTVTAGKFVIPHTDGTVKDTTSSSQEFALALQSGVAGDRVKIFILGCPKTVS